MRKRAIERARARGRAQWERMTDEERAAHAAKTRAAWAAKYPERAALVDRTNAAIQAGELQVEACGGCGADEATPIYDWATQTIRGWRCLDCKKRRD